MCQLPGSSSSCLHCASCVSQYCRKHDSSLLSETDTNPECVTITIKKCVQILHRSLHRQQTKCLEGYKRVSLSDPVQTHLKPCPTLCPMVTRDSFLRFIMAEPLSSTFPRSKMCEVSYTQNHVFRFLS